MPTVPEPRDRLCFWCRSQAVSSREHLFPDWLENEHLEIPPDVERGHEERPIRLRIRNQFGEKVKRLTKVGTHDTSSRGHCELCNNRWMSTIEAEAKPLVLRMMNGRPMRLSRERQLLLARWATMKAMSVDADERLPIDAITSLEDRDVVRHGGVPPHTVVRVAAQPELGSFAFVRPVAEGADGLKAFLATIVFGHLVVQVYGRTGSRQPTAIAKANGGLVGAGWFTAWPPQPETVSWPPVKVMSPNELRQFGTDLIPLLADSPEWLLPESDPRFCGVCEEVHGPILMELPRMLGHERLQTEVSPR